MSLKGATHMDAKSFWIMTIRKQDNYRIQLCTMYTTVDIVQCMFILISRRVKLTQPCLDLPWFRSV